MRKLLFQSLFRRPFTEPAPSADDAAVIELATAVGRASRRHADVLMVTGPVTKNMREALERTYHATPDPKWVIAIGDCARDGGCFAGSYAVTGGVSEVVPVDLHISGCPPTPTAMLRGLLALLERTDGQ